MVDEFNMNPNIDLFLLTVGCGGVGLTLRGADRVVLFDPSWNRSSDKQAVDRCYRIGQLKNTANVIYLFFCYCMHILQVKCLQMLNNVVDLYTYHEGKNE